jgi:hypothetical protein
MTPNSETIQWMEGNAFYDQDKTQISVRGLKKYEATLNDMTTHWLTKQGWTSAAIASGVVVPADYTSQKFQPNKNIQRYEIAVMADRALGLVSAAQQEETDALSFSDTSSIQDWAKGYVNEAVKAGVVAGYPDGSFGPKRTATRAEAVVMVSRALAYMEQGLQKDTSIVIQYESDDKLQTYQATLQGVTTQMVDGTLYVPLRQVFKAWYDLHNTGGDLDEFWNPLTQCYYNYSVVFDWTFSWKIKAGCSTFLRTESPQTLEKSRYHFIDAPRMLYGELMIPVYRADADGSQLNFRFSDGWDQDTNTMTLTLWQNQMPFVS